MAIDYREWQRLADSDTERSWPPEPQYKMVEQDQAWQQMTVWLREECERAERYLKQANEALQNNGDYSHEGLVKAKVLVDIRKAEVLLFGSIEKKVLSYTQEPDS